MSERFTNGKPFIVTDEQTKARWGGGFWCPLCGDNFEVGHRVRWVSAAGSGFRNFFVCAKCDTGNNAELIELAKEGYQQAAKLAKQWGIYGPDWEREMERELRRP